MDDHFDPRAAFGQLRSMLHQPPSLESFDTIMALIEQALHHDAEMVKVEMLPYIDHHIRNYHKTFEPILYIDPYSWDWEIYDPLHDKVFHDMENVHHPEVQLRHVQSIPLDTHSEEENTEWVKTVEMPFLRQLRSTMEDKDLFHSAIQSANAQTIEMIDVTHFDHETVMEGFAKLTKPLTNLQSLALRDIDLDDTTLVDFAKLLPMMPNLKRLDLHDNEIEDAGFRAFVQTPMWQQLTHIGLNNVGITSDSFDFMLRTPKATPLKFLALNNNEIEHNSLDLMATSKHMLELTFLDISDVFLDEKIIKKLVQIPFTVLDRLHLSSLNLSKEIMDWLGQWESLSTVRHLSLYQAHQNSKTLSALLQHDTVRNLRYLDIDENRMTKTGLRAIAKAKTLPNLEAIEIGWVEMEADVFTDILQSPNLPKLQYILTENYTIPQDVIDTSPFKYELDDAAKAYFGVF